MTNNIKKDNFYLYDEIFKGLSGDHLYTSINDFTVAVGGGAPATGSKTLTLSGLPTGVSLSPQSILAGGNVQKIDAQGNVWNVPLTNIVVVSASVTFVDFEGRFFSDDNILVVLGGISGSGSGAGGSTATVLCATTGNITIATALITGAVVDGITLAESDRVLVWRQTTASQNGVYVVGTVPARANDFNSESDIKGALILVQDGVSYENTIFSNLNFGNIVVDTTGLDFGIYGNSVEPTDRIIYVRVSGSDTIGDGKTDLTAFASLEKAIKALRDHNFMNTSAHNSVTINMGYGSYTMNEDIDISIANTAQSGSYYIEPEGAIADAMLKDAALEALGQASGTFTSTAENIHYDNTKTWVVDELVGKFVKVLSVSSGTIPGTYFIYLPIIRNGVDWVETPWAYSTGSNAWAKYEIVNPRVVINCNDKRILFSATCDLFHFRFHFIELTDCRQLASGNFVVNNFTRNCPDMIGCKLTFNNNYAASMKFSIFGTFTSYVYIPTYDNYFVAHYSSVFNFNHSTTTAPSMNAKATRCIVSKCVFRSTNASKLRMLGVSRTTLSIIDKNKFINAMAGVNASSKSYVELASSFYFDTVNFFALINSTIYTQGVFIGLQNNTAITFDSEPSIGRLSVDGGTSAATMYYDGSKGFYALDIAPDAYKLVNIPPKEYTRVTTATATVTVTLENIASNTVVSFSGTVHSTSTAGTTNVWNINGVIANISGTTTLRSTATVTAVLVDDATRTVAFVANDTTATDTLNMQLVGAGTVNWKAKLTYNQINL